MNVPPPQPLSVNTPAGSLAGLLHLPERIPAPAVVCCHGMLSSKDSRKFAYIGEQLVQRGVAVLRFDFSGCGQSRIQPADSLLSSRLRDLHAVLEYVQRQMWSDGRMGLVGSSLGGYLSLLALAARRYALDAVVCWATPFDLSGIEAAMEASSQLGAFFPAGFGLGAPVNLADLELIQGVLLIHGEQDETVPWTDALHIYQRAEEPKRLFLVREAEHRFLQPSCRMIALKASIDWLRERGLIVL